MVVKRTDSKLHGVQFERQFNSKGSLSVAIPGIVTLPHTAEIEDRSASENRDLTLGIPRHFAKTGTHGEQVRDTVHLSSSIRFLSASVRLCSTWSRSTQKEAHTHARTRPPRNAQDGLRGEYNYVGDFSVAVHSSLSLTRSFPLPSTLSLADSSLASFLGRCLPVSFPRTKKKKRRTGPAGFEETRPIVTAPREFVQRGDLSPGLVQNRNRPRMSTPPKPASIRAIRSGGLGR